MTEVVSGLRRTRIRNSNKGATSRSGLQVTYFQRLKWPSLEVSNCLLDRRRERGVIGTTKSERRTEGHTNPTGTYE